MRVYTMSARELMQDRAQEAERGLTDEARKPVGLKSSVAGVGEDVVIHYDKHDKGLFSQIFQVTFYAIIFVTQAKNGRLTLTTGTS